MISAHVGATMWGRAINSGYRNESKGPIPTLAGKSIGGGGRTPQKKLQIGHFGRPKTLWQPAGPAIDRYSSEYTPYPLIT